MTGEHDHERIGIRECLIHALVLFGILVCLFPGVFLRGDIAFPASVVFEKLPWNMHRPPGWELTKNIIVSEVVSVFNNFNLLTDQALRNGEWPLWNHLQLTGAPLLANYQSAVFYPPRILFRFFDNYTATTIFYLLKLWLCGATAYLCGRMFGLHVPGARFLSIGWMLSAFNMTWWYLPITDVSAWLPVVMMGAEFLLRDQYRRGALTMALGGALLLLGGHPESSFAMGLGAGAYFILRLLIERRRGPRLWKPVAGASLAWALAIAFCAVQLVPFIEYLLHSATFAGRAVGGERKPFIHGNTWLAFWIPRFFGFTADSNFWDERGFLDNTNFVSLVYPGIMVSIGVAALVAVRPFPRLLRARAIALAIPIAFSILLAYNFPLVRPILRLPLFNSMWGMHHIAFAMFALPLLAAYGVQRWSEAPRRPRDFRWPGAMVAWIAVACAGTYVYYSDRIFLAGVSDYIWGQIQMAAVFILLSFAVLAMRLRATRPTLLVSAAGVLLFVDLLWAARDMRTVEPREHVFPDIPFTRYLQSLPEPKRVSISLGPGLTPSTRQGILVPYGVEEAWGYEGIYPERITRYYAEGTKRAWDKLEPVCAIPYYVVQQDNIPPNIDRLEWLHTVDHTDIYRNPHAFPRAFLVGRVAVARDPAALFDLMCASDFDPRATTATERPPAGPLPNAASGDLGSAEVTHRSQTLIKVRAEAREPCVLVLADQFFPGWKATIDGRPAELFPAYYAFRGLVLPAGTHEVVYRYEPMSFRIGVAVTGLTCLATLLAGVPYLIFGLRFARADATFETAAGTRPAP